MRPPSRKATRSATLAAKPISCVTISMVMPFGGEAPHDLQDFADEFGIERGGRLVEQHQARLHGERPRDGDALLLAARQMAGIGAPCRRGRRASALGGPVSPPPPAGRRTRRSGSYVLQRAHMRPEIEMLEHHADFRNASRGKTRGASVRRMPSGRSHNRQTPFDADFAAVVASRKLTQRSRRAFGRTRWGLRQTTRILAIAMSMPRQQRRRAKLLATPLSAIIGASVHEALASGAHKRR